MTKIKNQKSKVKIAIQNVGFCIGILVFDFCILSFLSGCGRKTPREEIVRIPVRAEEVKRDTITESLFYVGDIKGRDEVLVYPKVTGKIIQKLAQEGDRVKKGDIIAYIDRDEVGFKFEKAPVEAPIDGIIGRTYVDIGTSVSSQTPVGLVADIDIVKVKVNVVERDLPKIKEGELSQIDVDAFPEERFEGRVERVSPIVDLLSRTAVVEIAIPNGDHRLKPGMFARIKILVNEREGILIIPRDAIIREDSSNYVFVVKDNRAYRKKIEIGFHEDNRFEVLDGLREGEFVITMGNTRLKEGAAVEVIKE